MHYSNVDILKHPQPKYVYIFLEIVVATVYGFVTRANVSANANVLDRCILYTNMPTLLYYPAPIPGYLRLINSVISTIFAQFLVYAALR